MFTDLQLCNCSNVTALKLFSDIYCNQSSATSFPKIRFGKSFEAVLSSLRFGTHVRRAPRSNRLVRNALFLADYGLPRVIAVMKFKPVGLLSIKFRSAIQRHVPWEGWEMVASATITRLMPKFAACVRYKRLLYPRNSVLDITPCLSFTRSSMSLLLITPIEIVKMAGAPGAKDEFTPRARVYVDGALVRLEFGR